MKKFQDRIQTMFDDNQIDEDFININISKESLQRLYDYQIYHVYNLLSCLKKKDVALDGSAPGTGKTYTAICVCKELDLKPTIICPKSSISIWHSVCDYFNIVPFIIINYESCHTKDFEKLDKKTLVILDEVHKCKNIKTNNGQFMLSLKGKYKMLLLSATISDTIKNFQIFGYMLDFYKKIENGRSWINSIIKEDQNKITKTNTLHKYLYPNHGSRMTQEDLGKKFPSNQISIECYTISDEDATKINDCYKLLQQSDNPLTQITKCRQIIEKAKTDLFLEEAFKYLEAGKSVVIFVNFTKTKDAISKTFNKKKITHSIIDGSQDIANRNQEITKFQTNQNKAIICMIQAGGQSISLHDTNGNHPRVSLISLSYSGIELIQALGRIIRSGTKSPVLQKIILCANTIEENIRNKIKSKINFLNYLSDQELIGL